jgi:hypothetical protein
VLLTGSIALLCVLLAGLSAVIIIDIQKQGWDRWLDVLRAWQSTLGTVIGFVGGAGVLILGTALERQAEDQRNLHAASAIGQALAYEAERMATGLELGRQLTAGVDMNDMPTVERQCVSISSAVGQQLQDNTPVFDASIQRLVDFGDQNLSDFLRFHAFYADLRQTLRSINVETCSGAAAEQQLIYMASQMKIGLGYYARFAPLFDITQFTPDGVVDNEADAT